jgi:hypothetical protein
VGPQRGRGNYLFTKSKVLEQSSHRRRTNQHRIGPGVDQVPAELLVGNLAPQPRPTLNKSQLHASAETVM